MTTPEARPAAPIEEHESREPRDDPDWTIAASTKWRNRVRRAVGNQAAPIPRGQLWQREAARDVQAHGEPRPFVPGHDILFVQYPTTCRTYVRGMIERRRPIMRAARAELEALRYAGRCGACDGWGLVSTMSPFGSETTYECPDCKGTGDGSPMPTRRLEPEPSSMARTGLALGLAFTGYGKPRRDLAPGA